MDVWRCTAGVASKEVWRSGDLEACCTCRDVEEFALRALEMRCRRVDVDILEVWRRAARVATWRRHRGSELWRCAAGVWTWRCRGMEIWSSGRVLHAW